MLNVVDLNPTHTNMYMYFNCLVLCSAVCVSLVLYIMIVYLYNHVRVHVCTASEEDGGPRSILVRLAELAPILSQEAHTVNLLTKNM